MSNHDEADDPRRRLLIQALSAGVLSSGIPAAEAQVANIFGSRPARLPPKQSIYRISGTATVNDKPANLETVIRPGDTVKTGKDSELVFVVNTNAMILRGGSNVIIESEKKEESLILSGLRMLSGALLSVSRNTPMRVRTATATVGIRGTGFYMEAEPDQTYFCTCYGATEVESNADPESKENIFAKQHDRPVYIVQDGGKGKNIRNAPFINHTDLELALIETLVGRTPPFIFPNDAYTAPRRNY
ncbi:MAG: FecR domain-containing protein [Betaproteobacteria bacterium]